MSSIRSARHLLVAIALATCSGLALADGPIIGAGGGGSNTTAEPQLYFNPSTSSGTSEAESAAAFGDLVTPDFNCTISGIGALLTTVSSGTYKLGIAPYNTGTNEITAPPTYSGTVTIGTGAAQKTLWGNLTSTVSLTAGATYVIFLVRTDSTSSVSQTVYYDGGPIVAPGFTLPNSGTAYYLASTAPTTSQAWSSAGNDVWVMFWTYTIP